MRLITSQIRASKQEAEGWGVSAWSRRKPSGAINKDQQSGFTMVELVALMIISGILAAMALPRFFDRNIFESRGFYDQTLATLRYARKVAIAQHRFVCVAVAANSITLTYDPAQPGATHTVAACSLALAGPDGQSPYTVTAPGDVTLSGGTGFNFNALGKPSFDAQASITVSDYAVPIVIEAETGYVH